MPYICSNPNCKSKVAPNSIICDHCGSPLPAPNVRQANHQKEILGLERIYQDALSKASKISAKTIRQFESNLEHNAQIVFARPHADVIANILDENKMHINFHQRLDAGGLIMEDNEYDPLRQSIDSKIFPGYYKNISFGVLSLNHLSQITNYGDCHMTLKNSMATERTSLFIDNSFETIESLPHKAPIPNGIRASWKNRTKLAVSKYIDHLNDKTKMSDHADILTNETTFIETNIYGSITFRTIGHFILYKRNNLTEERSLEVDIFFNKFNSFKKKANDWDVNIDVVEED